MPGVEDIYPYVPIATTLRLGVAMFSYCDRITFGITGDRDTTADIDRLAGAIQDELAGCVKEYAKDEAPDQT